jgi:calcineurin-like phosphoesterase family protein
MYWFTSDEHYGHTNVLKYNDRPFSSIEEMNEGLIANHNSVVSKNDVTIHAGDFCWLNKKEDVYKQYLNRLNGNHVLLIGSHDHWQPSSAHYIWRKRIEGNLIIVGHYAMRVWECSHYNSWHLFGHSHGRLEGFGKSFDIGVDCHNYYPWSWDEIVKEMQYRPDNFNLIKR